MQLKNQFKQPRNWKVVGTMAVSAALGVSGLALAVPDGANDVDPIQLQDSTTLDKVTTTSAPPRQALMFEDLSSPLQVSPSRTAQDLGSPLDMASPNTVESPASVASPATPSPASPATPSPASPASPATPSPASPATPSPASPASPATPSPASPASPASPDSPSSPDSGDSGDSADSFD